MLHALLMSLAVMVGDPVQKVEELPVPDLKVEIPQVAGPVQKCCEKAPVQHSVLKKHKCRIRDRRCGTKRVTRVRVKHCRTRHRLFRRHCK
jgi:hypothetical protein